MQDKSILFYDAECSLCQRFMQALKMVDKEENIIFRDINAEGIFTEFSQIDEEEAFSEVHLLTTEGKVLRGSEVIEFLVKLIPGVSKFAWLLESESSKKAMDMFYGKLNDMRIMRKRNCFRCGSPRRRKYEPRG